MSLHGYYNLLFSYPVSSLNCAGDAVMEIFLSSLFTNIVPIIKYKQAGQAVIFMSGSALSAVVERV